MKIQRLLTMGRQNNRTRNRIRNVIVRARAVIDRILAAARRPALKAVKLGDQAADIKQLALARIEQRQRVAINVALHPLGRNIVHIALLELLARPLASISIARHLRDAVSRQRRAKVFDHGLGLKRRPNLANAVKNGNTIIMMRDRQRHRIAGAAGRIAESKISRAGHGREFKQAIGRASLKHRKIDKRGNVRTKVCAILGRRTRRIALIFAVDEVLRYRRVHNPRRGLPDKVARVILAMPAPERIPKDAAARIRRAARNHHRVRAKRRHRRADRIQDFRIRVGRIIVAPKSKLVQHGHANRTPANGAIGLRVTTSIVTPPLSSISLAVTFQTKLCNIGGLKMPWQYRCKIFACSRSAATSKTIARSPGLRYLRQSRKAARNTAIKAMAKDLPPRRPMTSHKYAAGAPGGTRRPVHWR